MKPLKKQQIKAYGFDRIGHYICDDIETESYVLNFKNYDTIDSIASADGIIIPSGIFEDIKTHQSYSGSHTTCSSDAHKMAEIEKQIFNAVAQGAWVCFLLRHLDNGDDGKWWNKDLAKKIANQMFENVHGHGPVPHLDSKADEFREFFRTHGISRTALSRPKLKAETRILATSSNGDTIFSAEVNGKIFFLPLKVTSSQNATELVALIESAASSIIAYKQRNDLYIPDWVTAIKFKSEVLIEQKTQKAIKQLDELKTEAALWKNYKAILSSSGRTLNEVVVSILRNFFALNLKSEEAYVEDALIYNDSGELLFVVEIKGVNGGVKRDHVNQVDSHRERLGIPPTQPGLLIINDFSDVAGFSERKAKPIAALHLDLAIKQNVRILRTTTLLDFMLATENLPTKKQLFLSACSAGAPLVELPAT